MTTATCSACTASVPFDQAIARGRISCPHCGEFVADLPTRHRPYPRPTPGGPARRPDSGPSQWRILKGIFGLGLYWFLAFVCYLCGVMAGLCSLGMRDANDDGMALLFRVVCGGLFLLAMTFTAFGLLGLVRTIGAFRTHPRRG